MTGYSQVSWKQCVRASVCACKLCTTALDVREGSMSKYLVTHSSVYFDAYLPECYNKVFELVRSFARCCTRRCKDRASERDGTRFPRFRRVLGTKRRFEANWVYCAVPWRSRVHATTYRNDSAMEHLRGSFHTAWTHTMVPFSISRGLVWYLA